MIKRGIFIFHRDLRLHDNIGLSRALEESDELLLIFILTGEQLSKDNKYKSDNSVQFMVESLKELDNEICSHGSHLYYFYGKTTTDALRKIINEYKPSVVYFNEDYTPYARKRDDEIRRLCEENGVGVKMSEDYLLHSVGSIRTKSGEVYQKFTPYFNNARKESPERPVRYNIRNLVSNKRKLRGEVKDLSKYYKENEGILCRGGRGNGLGILKGVGEYRDYNKTRDNPSVSTTQLSGYIKFGCVSIREVYWTFREKLQRGNDLIKQLYWREFYYNLVWEYARLLEGKSLKLEYDKIRWWNDRGWFKRWCEGRTGYPIVDAGMRQLNKTGYMHNRLRLITSNFLIKLLLIDWRWGERYYAQHLLDYDPVINNGNWQWSSSSGADSQPYFRIFNPWLQSKKYDKGAEYIKRWVPELLEVDVKDIHKWDISYVKYEIDYPKPMVNYREQREECLKMYKKYIN